MKKEKKICKVIEQYNGDWPPEEATEAIAWFQNKLKDVPGEFRSTARIEIDSTSRYDSTYATIEIGYVRPETDEEEAQREKQSAAQADRNRANEMRLLAELIAKHGTPAA